MNKTELKNFATSSRRELLERVELKARKLGITAESIQTANVESSDAVFIDGKQLLDTERIQRNKLIVRINEIGFNRVMEETAYTWFNRFIALRYMEVNDYLPTKVRVLSSINSDSTEPDMMKEALSLNLELDKELIYDLKMNNKTDELFKYLIKMHCNDLNKYMPFMFETIADYTEILFPDGLLGTDSFIRKMTDTGGIPEDNWKKVEIIGWLYQYYISEENERVIQAKKRYKAEELPFATQLFTPEWIVRYMVQNTLGRYWIDSHPEHQDLIHNWEFYLENQNPEADFEEKLAPYINKELNVEDIKCFDPAMGSGHILVYMFDVLHEIYSKCGYMEREIPRLIIEKNLYGLDIDDRAYQLASFSVVMKALQYNKRFLRSVEREGLTMNLASIQETNMLLEEDVVFLAGESHGEQFIKMKVFIDQFKHAKTIGSLIKLESFDVEFLKQRQLVIENHSANLFELDMKDRTLVLLRKLIKQASLIDLKYDVFVTNPPYAGSKYLTSETSNYLNKNYPTVKSDLFSSFIEFSISITKDNGQIGFMTPFVWMFISTYEKLRQNIIRNCTISSLIQLEYSGFDGATVPICTFTLRNNNSGLKGEYIRLSEFRGAESQPTKTLEAVKDPSLPYRYSFNQVKFNKIPESPIVYWMSDKAINNFDGETISNILITREGMTTANNDLFLREWYEVDYQRIGRDIRNIEQSLTSKTKWFPYQKGGPYRKWYGNLNQVVNWENDGYDIKRNIDNETGRIRSHNYNGNYSFREGVTFPTISSGTFGARYSPNGYLFDAKGAMGFFQSKTDLLFSLALMNSSIAHYYLTALAPTLDFKLNKIMAIPMKMSEHIEEIAIISEECIAISKNEWERYEESMDFKKHPFLKYSHKEIKSNYREWNQYAESEFLKLKLNEEKLNRTFIEIYGLQDELTPELEVKDITMRMADLERDIKSFISYAVGCSFGRYSLDEEGLIYAGGNFDPSRYKTFPVDKDNISPILSGAYFEDDIVTRFVDFIRITYSDETLEENLDFVAGAIGRKKNETARETLRRYFLNDFYKDHIQVYKKRPIYWLFTSGKEKAFNCLIYMHRYDKSTLSRIRTDYLHEVQIRMDAEKKDLLNIIEGDSTTKEISDAKKELKSLDKKIDELKSYEELLHHMADMQIEIDLDDGVVANYEKFKGLVAKIK